MSFELPGTVMLLALLVPLALLVAFVRMPRWFARSMAKHALWRLRDEIVDDIRRGDLPDHRAVKELYERVDWAICASRSFDLLHLIVWQRAIRGMPEDTLRQLEKFPTLDGLSGDQADRVEAYRRRYDSIAIKATVLTSWIGVALLARVIVPVAVKGIREHARKSVYGVLRDATDEVATETRLGRSARIFVTAKGPSHDADRREAALV